MSLATRFTAEHFACVMLVLVSMGALLYAWLLREEREHYRKAFDDAQAHAVRLSRESTHFASGHYRFRRTLEEIARAKHPADVCYELAREALRAPYRP